MPSDKWSGMIELRSLDQRPGTSRRMIGGSFRKPPHIEAQGPVERSAATAADRANREQSPTQKRQCRRFGNRNINNIDAQICVLCREGADRAWSACTADLRQSKRHQIATEIRVCCTKRSVGKAERDEIRRRQTILRKGVGPRSSWTIKCRPGNLCEVEDSILLDCRVKMVAQAGSRESRRNGLQYGSIDIADCALCMRIVSECRVDQRFCYCISLLKIIECRDEL